MTISELSFFFTQALFEQSDNGSSVIFTTFPASSIRPLLMEDLWFIMGWKGEREGRSRVGWCGFF